MSFCILTDILYYTQTILEDEWPRHWYVLHKPLEGDSFPHSGIYHLGLAVAPQR